MNNLTPDHPQGFTLAEVLIALALLGVIAAFTIPKVLNNSGNAERNALMKESVSNISSLVYQGTISGELRLDNVQDYFAQKLNAIKVCAGDSSLQGCAKVPGSNQNPAFSAITYHNQPGMVLPNGVQLLLSPNGLNCGGCSSSQGQLGGGLMIDFNGDEGPNELCNGDRLVVTISYGSAALPAAYFNQPPGSVKAWDPSTVGLPNCNVTLFKQVMDLN